MSARSTSLGPSALLMALLMIVGAVPGRAQQSPDSPRAIYDKIRSFGLIGPALAVENLLLKRDRVEMTFTGTFVFTAPVGDRVTGAVFQGQGTFRAPVPPSSFERENVRRLLKADSVESSFETAVMIFTDDTFQKISAGSSRKPGGVTPAEAQRLAADFGPRILKETGVNLAARAAASILNQEQPGFFCAQFDGGNRGRFSLLLDYQNRIPVAHFGLNGGEKGLIFSYRQGLYWNEIWMAFYGIEDYERGSVAYSDTQDLVDIQHNAIDLDLRDPKKSLSLVAKIDALVRAPHLRALSLMVGENLSEYDEVRRKNQMRLKSARVGGVQVEGIQEDWEGGLTILLPNEVTAGAKLNLEVSLEGDFMRDVDRLPDCFYPYSNTSWYPRHGYLDRATYDLTFHHRNKVRIAATGLRVRESADPASKEDMITQYRITEPVSVAAFALGPFERHAQKIKWESGGETPLEFSSLPGNLMAVKESFILAELDNAMRYFTALFGKYPYSAFGAGVHPFGFGQGLPTLLMIPPASTANKETFAFISHETAHQWWGNIVAWRSYRDQWLSEGFAEYSGVLYAGERDSARSKRELIDRLRDSLKNPPRTATGVGSGRLNDVGPLILGHRLETSMTRGSYTTLIYNKGALVLRMLHFLFTDSATGNGQPFFDMMTAFVNRFRGSTASTDDFRAVANEHFMRTPNAQKYGLKDLDWFFNQWVMQVPLPSYRLEYTLEDQPGGAVILRGTIFQENAPDDWAMLLPVTFALGGNQVANANIRAIGPQTPVTLKLPRRPTKVELDPDSWILSEKTSTHGR
jgi:hypothetical protein